MRLLQKRKSRKLEEGLEAIRRYLDINEPAEIRKIVTNLLMSARDEILLLFSTANSFYRRSMVVC